MSAGDPGAILAACVASSVTAREAVSRTELTPRIVRNRMRTTLVFLLLVLLEPGAYAQSLAELAKQEEARRKSVNAPAKVYTNRDLKPEPEAPSSSGTGIPPDQARAAPDEPKAASQTPAASIPAATMLPGGKVAEVAPRGTDGREKGEAHWRALITAARAALERSRVLADALQSRLNALATDIVNRDDPAQRSQLEIERQRALDELGHTKVEISEHVKAIADIEEDARKSGVPPGWLR